jgi:hypothetical protein
VWWVYLLDQYCPVLAADQEVPHTSIRRERYLRTAMQIPLRRRKLVVPVDLLAKSGFTAHLPMNRHDQQYIMRGSMIYLIVLYSYY